MKKQAKQRMARRRDRFLVGYLGAKNLIFASRQHVEPDQLNDVVAVEPMTRLQARRLLNNMPSADCAIFELVPVEVNR